MGGRGFTFPVLVLALLAGACEAASPSLAEMSRIWRATAPRDDSYDTRCNDERRRLTEPLGRAIVGRSRAEVVALLGSPDEAPHPEAEWFGADNLNYSLGFCDDRYPAFVVSFQAGRVREAREVPSA